MTGDYDGVVAFRPQYDRASSPALADTLAWGYVMQGNALLDQANAKTGEEAEGLLTLAGEKLLVAESIKPGSAAYNLGCLSALRGDERGCRRWLEKGQRLGTLPDRRKLMNDPDLASVRRLEWFQRLVKSARG